MIKRMTSTQDSLSGLESGVVNDSYYAKLSDKDGNSEENHTYSSLKQSPQLGLGDLTSMHVEEQQKSASERRVLSAQNNTCDLEPSVTNYSQYAQLSDKVGNYEENHDYATLKQSPPLGLGDLTLSHVEEQQESALERRMLSTQNSMCDLEPSVTNYSQYAQLSDKPGQSDEDHTYSTLEQSPTLDYNDLTLMSREQYVNRHVAQALPRTKSDNKTKLTREKISVLIIIVVVLIVITVAAVIGVIFPKDTSESTTAVPTSTVNLVSPSIPTTDINNPANQLSTPSADRSSEQTDKTFVSIFESTVSTPSDLTTQTKDSTYQSSMSSTERSSVKTPGTTMSIAETTESTSSDFTTQRKESTYQPSMPLTQMSTLKTPSTTFPIAETSESTPSESTTQRQDSTYQPSLPSTQMSTLKSTGTTDSDCKAVSFTAVENVLDGPAPLFWYSSYIFSSYEFRRCYMKVVTTRNEKLVIYSRSEIGTYSDSIVSVGDVTGIRGECTNQRVVCMEIRTPGRFYTDWSLNAVAKDSTRVRVYPGGDSLQYLSSVSVNIEDYRISDFQIDQNRLEVSFLIENEFNEGTQSKVYCYSSNDKEEAAYYAINKCLRGSNYADPHDRNIVKDSWGIQYS